MGLRLGVNSAFVGSFRSVSSVRTQAYKYSSVFVHTCLHVTYNYKILDNHRGTTLCAHKKGFDNSEIGTSDQKTGCSFESSVVSLPVSPLLKETNLPSVSNGSNWPSGSSQAGYSSSAYVDTAPCSVSLFIIVSQLAPQAFLRFLLILTLRKYSRRVSRHRSPRPLSVCFSESR